LFASLAFRFGSHHSSRLCLPSGALAAALAVSACFGHFASALTAIVLFSFQEMNHQAGMLVICDKLSKKPLERSGFTLLFLCCEQVPLLYESIISSKKWNLKIVNQELRFYRNFFYLLSFE
jgi:hypothetical protein